MCTYHFSTNFITNTSHGFKLLGIAEGRFHPGDRGGSKGSGRADEGGDDGGLHGCFGVNGGEKVRRNYNTHFVEDQSLVPFIELPVREGNIFTT